MQENKYSDFLFFEDEKPINYREKIEKYLFHWKWFAVCVVLALLAAYIYLRYTPNTYEVAAVILIDEEASGNMSSELSVIEDLGLLGSGKKSIENEIGLLKSSSLMEGVVKELNLNISYFKPGRVQAIEVYKNDVPYKVTFLNTDAAFYAIDTTFSIVPVSATHFKLKNSEGDSSKEYLFGSKVTTNMGPIMVTPTAIATVNESEIEVHMSNMKNIVQGLRSAISVDVLYKKSTLIELKLQTTIRAKGQDILNTLVENYNKNGVEDKNLIGNNTALFINERLSVIESDLLGVDKGVENFKTTNKLTDITSEASIVLENNSLLEKKIIDLNTQMKLADYLSQYTQSNKDQLIPQNLGMSNGNVNASTEKYNELLLERNRLLKTTSEKHPIVQNVNEQLAQLRVGISQGLVNLKSSLKIALNDAMREESSLHSRIYAVPKQEREFRDIQRQQQIIETLYLFLLQKREENAISLAITVPNAKMIDAADGNTKPVGPKRKVIYLVALMLGFVVPFIILYIRFLIDNKVHTSKDVEAVVKSPMFGEIPATKEESKLVVNDHEQSAIAESFRMLRTNLYFMLAGTKVSGKTVFITSTVPGEGKTFISLNLAAVLAMSNKKVLLIGADIRKPKFVEYLNMNFSRGLTHFLMDDTLKPEEVIDHYPKAGFDIVSSGVVPPNPSELLMNGRFDTLITYAQANYDYVIVDTAPVQAVTDTLLLSHHAHVCLYVIRANYLDKRLLEVPEKIANEKRLPNMAIIVNDVNLDRGYGYGAYGYGYGYGYGGDEKKKAWWKKWFKL